MAVINSRTELIRLHERECGLIAGDTALLEWSSGQRWSHDNAGRLESLNALKTHSISNVSSAEVKHYKFTGISFPAALDIYRLTEVEANGTLMCGPYFALLTTHAFFTKSSVSFERLGNIYRQFQPKADVLLLPATSMVIPFVEQVFNFSMVSPFRLGTINSLEVYHQRPFLFLQVFENRVWALIGLSLLVCSLLAVLRVKTMSSQEPYLKFVVEPISVVFYFLGLGLKQGIQTHVKNMRPIYLLIWALAVTVLAGCFDGAMRDLLARALDPIVLNDWDDLLRDEYSSVPIMYSTLDPAMNSLKQYKDGSIFRKLQEADRFARLDLSELLSKAIRLCISGIVYAGNLIVLGEDILVQKQFVDSLIESVRIGVKLQESRLKSIHYGPPQVLDYSYLPIAKKDGSTFQQWLTKSYSESLIYLGEAGLINLWFTEGASYLKQYLPDKTISEYTQTRIIDLNGANLLYGSLLLLSITILLLELLIPRRYLCNLSCTGISKERRQELNHVTDIQAARRLSGAI